MKKIEKKTNKIKNEENKIINFKEIQKRKYKNKGVEFDEIGKYFDVEGLIKDLRI